MDNIILRITKSNIDGTWMYQVKKDGEFWFESNDNYDSRQEAEADALKALRGMYSKSPNCNKVEYTFDLIG